MTLSDERAHATEAELLQGLTQRLERELDGEVQFDEYSRHMFSRDASMYSITPLCIVFPRHADDVAATVRIAAAYGVAVTPRGAGTSLAGQTVGAGIVVDFSRHMTSILELDPRRRIARVEVGVVQDELNGAAAPFGLMFGPDTSTSNRATIGGMLGNNSAGSGSLRFGMTIDHVRAVDVVLSDGSIARFAPVDDIERHRRASVPTLEGSLYRELPVIVEKNADAIATGFPPFWRRACGYRLDRLADPETPFDLARFIVGSEGTLAIATAVEVDLVPKPKHTVYAVGHFDATQKAIEATTDALSCEPAQVELMDKTILDLSRQKLEYASLGDSLVGDPAALLFVSFTGDDLDHVLTRLDGLIDLWQRNGHGYHTLRLVTAEQQSALLKVRKSSLGLLMAASEGSNRPLAFVEDTAVPPEVLAEYTARFAKILDEYDMTAGFYGHCSVGCLHIRPFVDLSRPDEIVRMRAVAERIKDLVKEFGGVNSSEHGDGLARSEFNREIFGDELYEAMRDVKRLFDPDHREPTRCEPPADTAAAHPAGLRAPRRHARCRRSVHEHRSVPQEHDRGDVPVVHRHPRRGTRHPRAGERARESALRTRPESGARQRTPARDPRPVPDVQGMQGGMPARCGHGQAQERDTLALPRRTRSAAAFADFRFNPRTQPPRVSTGSRREPRRPQPAGPPGDGPRDWHRSATAHAAVQVPQPHPLVRH
jgi:FAD/FMN-containing dehydrogenase